MTREIHVVGAVIVNDGRVLCAQRGLDGALPGLWEFPGGKIEQGESARAALEREILEELECSIEVRDEVTTTAYEYDFGIVRLTTFYCRLGDDAPRVTEHSNIKWLSPTELDTLDWAPADLPAVALVRTALAR